MTDIITTTVELKSLYNTFVKTGADFIFEDPTLEIPGFSKILDAFGYRDKQKIVESVSKYPHEFGIDDDVEVVFITHNGERFATVDGLEW